MEITTYINKTVLNQFYEDNNLIGLIARSLPQPIINKKNDIFINIPIKTIIPDKIINDNKEG